MRMRCQKGLTVLHRWQTSSAATVRQLGQRVGRCCGAEVGGGFGVTLQIVTGATVPQCRHSCRLIEKFLIGTGLCFQAHLRQRLM